MADIIPCLPYEMEREIHQMKREGWRIISARGDTGIVVATYYGNASVFMWDKVEQRLKKIRPGRKIGGGDS